MEKILVSACLLGDKVRYDAQSKKIEEEIIATWQSEGRVISICPEVIGGLPVPRPPAEIIMTDQDLHIETSQGEDVTVNFMKGAAEALNLVRKHNIHIALFKEGSPSCGSFEIYDGTFSNTRKMGEGLTTALLRKNGVQVFSENEIEDAKNALEALSNRRKHA